MTQRTPATAASLSVPALGTLVSVLLPACYQPARIPETRFRTEYNCEEVDSLLLGGGAVRVMGCGHVATYVCVDDRMQGQICVRDHAPDTSGGSSPAAPPPPDPGRLELAGTMIDGANAVRLHLAPSGLAIVYAPSRDRDRAGFSVPADGCSEFYVRHPGGQVGSLDGGLSLVDLASLPDDGQLVIVACDDILRLTTGERGELDRFIEHATRLRSGS